MDIIDVNARVVIAFALTMILAVLVYVVFFKSALISKKNK